MFDKYSCGKIFICRAATYAQEWIDLRRQIAVRAAPLCHTFHVGICTVTFLKVGIAVSDHQVPNAAVGNGGDLKLR